MEKEGGFTLLSVKVLLFIQNPVQNRRIVSMNVIRRVYSLTGRYIMAARLTFTGYLAVWQVQVAVAITLYGYNDLESKNKLSVSNVAFS